MRKKPEVIDEDGNLMPMPAADASDVEKAVYLLEYARLRGFRIGPTLKVGGIVTQVRDIRQEVHMTEHQKEAATPDLLPGSDMALLLGGETPEDE